VGFAEIFGSMTEERAPQLTFTRAAKMDIKDAAHWYKARSAELGNRFLAAVDEVTARLRTFPESSPGVHPRIRRAIVPDFPYSLFYTHEAHRIKVIAVVHWRRDPARWPTRPS
jgi:plasmid stabilization system protein ParE